MWEMKILQILKTKEVIIYCLLWGCVCSQSCLTVCDPMDCSPPGSFVYGISQVRILRWVAIAFSRGSY